MNQELETKAAEAEEFDDAKPDEAVIVEAKVDEAVPEQEESKAGVAKPARAAPP